MNKNPDQWPIAAAMLPFPATLADGTAVQDAGSCPCSRKWPRPVSPGCCVLSIIAVMV